MSKPFKSAGIDGIVPALLQQGTGHLADICAVHLQPVWQEGMYPKLVDRLMRCLLLNPGRLTILRLRHIILLICHSCWWWYKNWCTGISGARNRGLIPYTETSLPTNQVKSIETALHIVVTNINGRSETSGNGTQEFFLHSGRAFDRSLYEIIIKAAEQHGLWHKVCYWVSFKWGCTKITAILAEEKLEGSVAQGCWHWCI